jgi:hypothetical protein
MELNDLKLGNELHEKIRKSGDVLDCFEWTYYNEKDELVHEGSREPTLIIEFDSNEGGRDTLPIPFVMNPVLIELIKDFVINERFKLEKEFKEL